MASLDSGNGVLPAEPVLVVLDELRAALRVLDLRTARRQRVSPPSLPLSSGERSRLLGVAMRVLTTAAIEAEAECHRLLLAAEAEATSIVRQAHDDVTHMTEWLDAGASEATGVPPPPPPPEAPSQQQQRQPPAPLASRRGERAAPAPDLGWEAAGDSDDDDIGAEFFASFASDGTDRWSFLDDDNLVGVAPGLVRRLLRRPAGPRSPIADQ